MLESTLGKLAAHEDLSRSEIEAAMGQIMRGECRPEETAFFLTALASKGETVEEIAGAATIMRREMTPIRTRRTGLLDTCGTGGDGSATFNISTAAAIVTAAAGVPVAKHGNRKVTSRTGSADVLAALGVNIEADLATTEACLDELGLCFCFAPLLHSSMRHVAAVRAQLGLRTIFNLLGPLTNPAGAEFQLLGVGRPELRAPLAEVLALLGARRAVVVSGRDGLDEVTLTGPTDVTVVGGGPPETLVWQPADFGLTAAPLDSLVVDGPQQSAAVIQKLLAGQSGPARDIVVLNVAAAIWTAGQATDLRTAATTAQAAIDSGAARNLLAALIERTQNRHKSSNVEASAPGDRHE